MKENTIILEPLFSNRYVQIILFKIILLTFGVIKILIIMYGVY